jgi:TPR repeat protein
VAQDYIKAMEWWRLAAAQGDLDAQYNLGVCYERGEGVEVDYEEAVKWYRIAAKAGHEDAYRALDALSEL